MATMDGQGFASDTVKIALSVSMEQKSRSSGHLVPQLGYTLRDATPPTIVNVSGDPSASSDPITFDIMDSSLRLIVLTASYGGDEDTDVVVIYHGAGAPAGFQPGWTVYSEIEAIDGGYSFSVLPDGGWPAGADGAGLSLSLAVSAVDTDGNIDEVLAEEEDILLSITVSGPAGTWRPTAGTDRRQFTAQGTYSVSGPADVTALATWTSTAPTVASVSATGEAAPLLTGSTLITATIGAVSGNSSLTIDTDRDATSTLRLPANVYQWTLGGYILDGLYLCNEVSGNLTDTGPGNVTLTANATPLYGVAAAGWSKTGVGFNGTLNQRFTAASGAGPSPTTVDTFWCFLVALPAVPPATGRMVLVNGTNNNVSQLATTGYLRKTTPGNTVDDTTTLPHVDDLVHPVGLLHDSTSTRSGLFTDEAKTLGTYAAVSDSIKGIGSGTPPEAGSAFLYGFRLRDANARMTDAAIKALYQWLGFTVPWS